ncbi:MAG: hypothetical protein V4615_03030 [Bacteroidota bacterium]
MKNLKTTIITALLLLAIVSGAVAQEKYDFAVVSYTLLPKKVRISINGEFTAKGGEGSKDLYDFSPVLREVADMQEKGWEVFNTYGMEGASLVFILRKKKQ